MTTFRSTNRWRCFIRASLKSWTKTKALNIMSKKKDKFLNLSSISKKSFFGNVLSDKF